jgi:hypothetical protein
MFKTYVVVEASGGDMSNTNETTAAELNTGWKRYALGEGELPNPRPVITVVCGELDTALARAPSANKAKIDTSIVGAATTIEELAGHLNVRSKIGGITEGKAVDIVRTVADCRSVLGACEDRMTGNGQDRMRIVSSDAYSALARVAQAGTVVAQATGNEPELPHYVRPGGRF